MERGPTEGGQKESGDGERGARALARSASRGETCRHHGATASNGAEAFLGGDRGPT